jgi:hypothetical protein
MDFAWLQKLLQQSEFFVQDRLKPLHGRQVLAGAGGGLHVPFLQHTRRLFCRVGWVPAGQPHNPWALS